MSQRKIIKIDEEKCDGCGLCVTACHEGAIQLVDGKARLVSDIYCDGLGDCLGHCPQDAITIETREAAPFDEEAVKAHLAKKTGASDPPPMCPGIMMQKLKPAGKAGAAKESADTPAAGSHSELCNWPVQLKLVPPNAPYFKGADLILAADCVPFAMADFHSRLLRGHPVIIGCPKLDDTAFYEDKLTDLLKIAGLKSITVVHMEVPCCSGLLRIVSNALAKAGSTIPFKDVTISICGDIMEEKA